MGQEADSAWDFDDFGKVLKEEPLAKHTTWKIGGPADWLVEPTSVEELVNAMEWIQEENLPWRAVGRGSNLLVDDDGIEGVVLKFGTKLANMENDNGIVTVEAGYPLVRLATILSRDGYGGMEFAGGIPGSVGGAVFMNAGAHGSDMSKLLIEALILFPDGTMEWIPNEEMGFAYRTSRLQSDKGICVAARLKLEQGEKDVIFKEMQEYKEYRRETQPWAHPCAGSVFRNPLPDHAGELIENIGLKGHVIGGAQISELHANFIVNTGEAKASDVLALIEKARSSVKEAYGIELETEVEIVNRRSADS